MIVSSNVLSPFCHRRPRHIPQESTVAASTIAQAK